jgi:arylsulfatase
MEPHDPYTPPAELAAPVLAAYSGPLREASTPVLRGLKERGLAGEEAVATPDDVRYLRGLYDAEVAAFDAGLGAFLAELSGRGALEHTLVVLTSDHGEEFYEHGSFLHGHELYEELIHVPLILWGPGSLEPGRTERPVSLVDLSDTVCALLVPGTGAPTLLEVAAGRGEGAPLLLFNNLFDSSAHVNGLLGDRWKVLHHSASGRHRLYDLERDPHERDDRLAGVEAGALPEADPRRVPVQSLERELGALAPPPRELLEVADPRAQEALRALGYVE